MAVGCLWLGFVMYPMFSIDLLHVCRTALAEIKLLFVAADRDLSFHFAASKPRQVALRQAAGNTSALDFRAQSIS